VPRQISFGREGRYSCCFPFLAMQVMEDFRCQECRLDIRRCPHGTCFQREPLTYNIIHKTRCCMKGKPHWTTWKCPCCGARYCQSTPHVHEVVHYTSYDPCCKRQAIYMLHHSHVFKLDFIWPQLLPPLDEEPLVITTTAGADAEVTD